MRIYVGKQRKDDKYNCQLVFDTGKRFNKILTLDEVKKWIEKDDRNQKPGNLLFELR